MSDVDDVGKKVWLLMHKSRPHIGKTLIYTDQVLRLVGNCSGQGHISIIGKVFGGLGKLVLKYNHQVRITIFTYILFLICKRTKEIQPVFNLRKLRKS